MGSSVSCPRSDLLAADLLGPIAKCKPTENVVFSPMSIQAALAMIYLGAAGKTAKELENGLHLTTSNKAKIGKHFAKALTKIAGQAEWSIANRVFVSSDYELRTKFNKRSEKYFNSGVKTIYFKDMSSEAIKTINTWVENETNERITNCMQPGAVDRDAVAVIVNAISFEGKWSQPFNKDLTSKRAFWISHNEFVVVDIMFATDMNLKYGVFPELNATAIEIPYNNSDISMMLFLPLQREGLADLESKISSIPINEFSSKMTNEKVDELMIPKFKIELSFELPGVLKEIGIRSLFEKANLPGILKSKSKIKVSNVLHKAFIDVNESGSEAITASLSKDVHASENRRNPNQKSFKVDHPFFFVIKDSDTIYFVGHVLKL